MLPYIKIGTGAKVMVGFHGFGRDASMFQNYENVFPDYTIYSISLFYHGSDWRYQDENLDAQRWKSFFGDFLASEGIQNFSLLGFSLGGKVALYTFQLFSSQVDKLHLIAPYGIKKNVVEWITQKLPSVYRSLEKFVHKPAPFLAVLRTLRKYKLMNTTLLNITMRQMGSLKTRQKTFLSMGLYGALRLDLPSIKRKLETSRIPVTFYLGHSDKILTTEALNRYLSKLMDFSLHVLPGGHGSLPDKVIRFVEQYAYQ